MTDKQQRSGITKITIENFKGVSEPISVSLHHITLLFGTNSAGKSTVLHAMLLTHELLEHLNASPDRTAKGGDDLDLGCYENFVHRGKEAEGVTFRYDINLSSTDWDKQFPVSEFLMEMNGASVDVSDRGLDFDTCWVKLNIGPQGDEIVVRELEIGFDGQWFARLGRWQYRDELSDDAKYSIILNEFHPALALPGEEDGIRTGNLYGVFGSSSQTLQYRAYFDDSSSTDLNELQKEYFPETTDFMVLNICDITPLENSIRYTYLKSGISETGICQVGDDPRNKEIKILRFFAPTSSDKENIALTISVQTRSVDAIPDIKIPDVGIPDLRAPIQWEWPIENYAKYIDRVDTGHSGAQAALFLQQILDRLIRGPLTLLKDELDGIRYIGPLRTIPPRTFSPLVTAPQDRWSHGLAAWDRLHFDHNLCEKVGAEMRDTLHLGCSLEWKELIQLAKDDDIMVALSAVIARYDDLTATHLQKMVVDPLKELPERTEVLISDHQTGATLAPGEVGVGISQVVPVLVGALAPPIQRDKGTILAVEQPELHVHPAAQVGIGDVFIAAAKNEKRMFLIETHSEHLILRLLRRIRETTEKELPEGAPELTTDDVAVYYVEGGEDGMTAIEIPITPDGDFADRWPNGFFAERATELFGESMGEI